MARLPGGYWRLWTAGTISNLGDGVRNAALPLLAASWTTDPFSIALLTATSGLPWLLLGLPSGALVDRWDRRRLMFAANVVRAAVMAALAVVVIADMGELALLYVVAFTMGLSETLFDNAAPTVTAALVPAQHLEVANGRLYAAETVTNEFVGPPLGAILFAVAAALPFAADATSFLLAGVVLLSLRGSFRPDAIEPRRSLIADIREGLRWLRDRTGLRRLVVASGIWSFVDGAWFSLFVLYALRVLHVSEGAFGLLLTAGGIGALAASLLASRIVARVGRSLALSGSLIVAAATQVALASTTDPIVAAVALAVSGASFATWNVVSASVRQALVPDRLLGRISGVYHMVDIGGEAIGALAGGVLAASFGIRAPLLIGVPLLLVLAIASRSPFRELEDPRSRDRGE